MSASYPRGVPAPDPAFSTTLANGLAILASFRNGDPVLSNRDIAERTGLSKATVSRLTHTLTVLGLLQFDPRLRRYRPGAEILALCHPLLVGMPVRQIARPLMRELALVTGGSVSLGVYDNLHMVYVETSRSHDLASFRPDIGARLPLLCSAMGRAWLAGAAPASRDAALARMQQENPMEYDRSMQSVAQAQEDWRQHGYCVSHGDWQVDVHAVAVPMGFAVDGDLMVFNCGVHVARLRDGEGLDRVAVHLRAMVRQVEERLRETRPEQ